MGTITRPSRIPPRLRDKLMRMRMPQRREYVQEIIGSYERSILAIERRGSEIAEAWSKAQAESLREVVEELRELANL